MEISEQEYTRLIEAMQCTDALDAVVNLSRLWISEMAASADRDYLTALYGVLRWIQSDLRKVDQILLDKM